MTFIKLFCKTNFENLNENNDNYINKNKRYNCNDIKNIIVFLILQVISTNSDSLIPKSLQPNVVELWYLKLWILLDQNV